jgi:NAD(P)-dependent dehydrogenase (short-subunit alcohol dehydrogenase family)
MAPRVWLITGVSSGFGREIAKAALDRGDTVAGTVRQSEQLEEFRKLSPPGAHAYRLDVSDTPEVARVVHRAIHDLGRIDVVVNNAGYGLMGLTEEVSDQEARRVFDTNFFGLLNVIRAVLPQLRAQRSGHIVNMSSTSGGMGIPGMALYCASKFAVEGLSEALAGELTPFGIRVTLIEPGGFRTDFAGRSIVKAARVIPEYASTPAGRLRELIKRYSGAEPGDPAKAARAILEVVDSANPPLRLALGPEAIEALRARLDRVGIEYEQWRALSSGTNLQ